MKAAVILMLVVALLGAPQEPSPSKEKEIAQALAWFSDPDPEVSQSARSQLLLLGKDALPAIEKKLTEKGVLAYARLLRDLDHGVPPPDPYVLPEDVATAKVERETVEKYLRSKYAEALAWARKAQYQKGLDMTAGILALEPRSEIADRVKQLRRYCESMITQTSLVEAKLIQEKLGFVAGEPVTLTLRLKNIYKKEMTIRYEGAEGKVPEGLAVIEIEATVRNLSGESVSASRHQEFPFEGEIPLAVGGQWERKVLLDTVFGLPDDVELQTVVVNAWTQPSKIDTDGINITRRLQFESAVVKLVPKRYAHLLENPLEWLSKTIRTDRPVQETWICAQLLSGEDRRKGALELARAMEQTDNPDYRPALARMLTELTGEKLGTDPKKWTEWLSHPGPDKKKK